MAEPAEKCPVCNGKHCVRDGQALISCWHYDPKRSLCAQRLREAQPNRHMPFDEVKR